MFFRIIQHAIQSVFPPLCVHCGREGSWLCPVATVLLAREQIWIDTFRIPGIDHIILRGSYDHPVIQAIIQKLKYHYWTGLRDTLPEVLAPLTVAIPGQADIVPVPLHPRRQRERGYNQSLLLATALAASMDRSIDHLLVRTRHTAQQATLHEAERYVNVAGAFALAPRIEKIPRSAILVDDVLTTGATFRECAAVLRRYGVDHVTAVALAKG